MSFNFTVKEFIIGNGNGTPTLQFYKRGFELNGGGESPSWQDIILSGNTALTLTNAKANSLNYLKLFGGTVQNGTPTPTTPIDIVCNNGVVKVSKNLFDYRYFYDNYHEYGPSSVGRCPIKLKPNTTYTVSTNTDRDSSSASMFVVSGNDITWAPNTSVNGVTVANPRTVTTDSEGYLCFGIYVKSDSAIPESAFINGTVWVQIEQGSAATSYRPYRQIYTNGTVETVDVHGKNLFDGQWQVGIYNISSGVYTATANRICNVNMIQVKPSTNYTVSCPSYALAAGMRWLFYDKNKNFISTITNGVTTVTTPATARYINFCIANNLTVETAPNLQLEESSTATTYEAYFNGGQATAEMLLSAGDYRDKQSVIDGGVTRNVGIKVLDGTEDWVESSTTAGKFNAQHLLDGADARITQNTSCFCTHFLGVVPSISLANMEDLTCKAGWVSGITNNDSLYVAYAKYENNLVGFKQFLADQYANGTPVIIVYPLATPTTETVTGQPLTTQAGTNIVEITQASIDDLELEVSYKATV